KVSAKYLATIWSALEEKTETVGPGAKLQSMWRALPAPKGNQPDLAADGCGAMRDFVVKLRVKIEPRFTNLSARGIGATAQPFLMGKNPQYASHRMTYDRSQLQIQGSVKDDGKASEPVEEGATNEFGPGRTPFIHNKAGDPDLAVPAGQREAYEAAFDRF